MVFPIPRKHDGLIKPLRPGTLIGRVPRSVVRDQDELTPQELALLQAGAWQTGDPLPDLEDTAAAKRLRDAVGWVTQNAIPVPGEAPLPLDTPPLPAFNPVPVEALPAEKQAEVYKTFDELAELRDAVIGAKYAAEDEVPAAVLAAPGAAAAINMARQARIAQGHGIGIVNDLDNKPTAEAQPQTEEAVPQSCSAEQKPEVEHEITAMDKLSFLACLMGDDNRIVRSTPLFGNRIEVAFRTLLPIEETVIFAQLNADRRAGKLHDEKVRRYVMTRYYMAASFVEYVRNKPGEAQRLSFPPLESANRLGTVTRLEATALPSILSHLDKDVFVTAPVANAVLRAWLQFDKTMKFIAHKAETDPDFFTGIE